MPSVADIIVEAERLQLGPDDVVVIRLPTDLRDEQIKRIADWLNKKVGNVPLFFLASGAELKILDRSQLDAISS